MRLQDVVINYFWCPDVDVQTVCFPIATVVFARNQANFSSVWSLVCPLHKSGQTGRVAVKLLQGLFEFLEAKLDDSQCQKHGVTKKT